MPSLFKPQAPVVQKMDNAIHWMNLFRTDSVINVNNNYIFWITIDPVDKQLGPSFSELYWVVFSRERGNFGASTQLRNIFAISYKIMIFYFLAL